MPAVCISTIPRCRVESTCPLPYKMLYSLQAFSRTMEIPVMRLPILLAISLLLVSSSIRAQSEWFPPDLSERAAHQMLTRLTQAGVELPNSDEDQLQRSRALIAKLVTRIDAWGLEGVTLNTPHLEKIEMPEFGNPIIASMAIFGACSMPLEPNLVNTAEEKSVVVLGEMSIVVLSAFLKDRFLAGGGTEQELADALSSDAMNRLFYEIQATEDTRNYIATECAPAFEALWKN